MRPMPESDYWRLSLKIQNLIRRFRGIAAVYETVMMESPEFLRSIC